ncbi:uncharacterized protein LOC125675581 [Ostrea edulis]|uniref:uncharacterized protein LOC125675581 n=1 Tax=Ostrea edulis TaxID=37623 RepID=UPI0024AEB323|nr:uncharacterized protein LOC125675581 [Ostrea edulis]
MAFRCNVCDVSFDKINHLNRHNLTRKHLLNDSFKSLMNTCCDKEENIDNTTKFSSCSFQRDAEILENSFATLINDDDSDTDGETEPVSETEDYDLLNEGFSSDSESQTYEDQTNDSKWYPFPDKLSLLLYGLLHSTTHHISLEVAKYVWFILKEVGVPNVPSLNHIRNMKFGDLDVNSLIAKGEDDNGLPLYILKPTEIAKLHLSNPSISKNIARYPRKTGLVREQRDGSRLHEIGSPWASFGDTHFHVGNVVESTADHIIGIIRSFYESEEENFILADLEILKQERNEDNQSCLVKTTKCSAAPLSSLSAYSADHIKIMEMATSGKLVEISDEEKSEVLNSYQNQRIPKLSIPVNLFIDDTSTNISRRWLPMHCAQMQLAGVPFKFRNSEVYSNYLGASEHASMMSISKVILQDIKSSQQIPFETFHAEMKTCVKFTMEVASLIADFNMLSLTCNHAGATTLKFCPKCHADRNSCLSKQRERTPQETKRTVERLNMRGTEASKKPLRKDTGVKEYDNPFWDILNPHRDVPSGLLHLFHLGTSKHLFKVCIDSLTDTQATSLESHLTALDAHQRVKFNITKNVNSRQGKDLKKFIQVAPFSFEYAGLDARFLKMTCVLSLINRIVHLDTFAEEDVHLLDNLVEKYLILVERHVPELMNKVKTHLMTHLTDEIIRHGPPLAYSEDVFEKRHGVIRAKLFHQENQLARSRDTAVIFGKSYLFQHVIVGGYFTDNGTWRQCTKEVQDLSTRKEMCNFFGNLSEIKQDCEKPLLLRPLRTANNKTKLQDMSAFQHQCLLLQGLIDLGIPSPCLEGKMISYQMCRCKDGSSIAEGMSIMYLSREDEFKVGIFKGGLLLLQGARRSSLAIVEKGVIQQPTHLGCPVIEFSEDLDVIPITNVLSYMPLVHHCIQCHCSIKEGKTPARIEQEETELKHTKFIKHKLSRGHRLFLVNVYSLKCPSSFDFSKPSACAKSFLI